MKKESARKSADSFFVRFRIANLRKIRKIYHFYHEYMM